MWAPWMSRAAVVGMTLVGMLQVLDQVPAQALATVDLAPGQSPEPGVVLAWGSNFSGQSAVPLEAQSGVTDIAAGDSHSLALKSGRVIAWGTWGGPFDNVVPLEAQSGVAAIAAGKYHSLALKDGSVITWGRAAYGNDSDLAVPAEAQSGVVSIAAGLSHSLALKETGEVVAWGWNDHGQSTVPVEARSGVTAIAAGGTHSLALKGGRVIAWGNNYCGQVSVPPEAQSDVTAIAAGGCASLALKNGEVIMWGLQWLGQGVYSGEVPPEAKSGVVAIASGESHSLAVTDAGRVIGWGSDQHLQTRLPIEAESGVMAVSAGFYHSMAIRKPVVIPGSVTNLKATPAKGSIRVTWSAPSDMGGATSVTYQYQVGRQAWKSTSTTSATVRGKKSARITVNVRAVNQAGSGPSVTVSGSPR